MTTAEILIAAKALINTPESWAQLAYEGAGSPPKCYCPMGAVNVTAGLNSTHGEEFRGEETPMYKEALFKAVGVESQHEFEGWNDQEYRTHQEVMTAFDRAIEMAAA
jgi:hypothetical protein